MGKPRTLAGAIKRIDEMENTIRSLNESVGKLSGEKIMLAKLAAKGPAFFHPLDAAEAESIRDETLELLGMNPDGTFRK